MRISGITIPEQKRLEYGLTAVYGVGHSRARDILDELKIDHGARPADLDTAAENKIREKIEAYMVEGELRRHVSGNIKRLKDIQTHRGTRHFKRLPTKGQRTKTNARTLKGVKKTMGSGKRKLEKT